jgi:hypothetical protein
MHVPTATFPIRTLTQSVSMLFKISAEGSFIYGARHFFVHFSVPGWFVGGHKYKSLLLCSHLVHKIIAVLFRGCK